MFKRFKFSVIMPIYNTGDYLHDSISSIINQTIGFKKNIQLILVNDGSTDNSHDICTEFANKYPGNIIYLNQVNQGISAARNSGIPYIKGKYVNFFDSDDIWNTDVFENVYNFFKSHKKDIDVVSCSQKYFEAKSGFHTLNKKFEDGNRVIDINIIPEHIQLSVTSSFISASAVKRHRFDTRLCIGEDAKFLTEIILEREKYAVMQTCIYNIRKRYSGTSLTQSLPVTKYTDTIEYYYKYLPELSIKKYNCIIPYIQHVMINGLKYRVLASSTPLPLSDREKEKYISDVTGLIKLIDDNILLKALNLHPASKLYLLKLKYGFIPYDSLTLKNNKLYFNSLFVGNMSIGKLFLHEKKLTDGNYHINGYIQMPFKDGLTLQVRFADSVLNVDLIINPEYDRLSISGEQIIEGKSFELTIPADKKHEAVYYIVYKDHFIKQKPVFLNDHNNSR